MILSWKKKIPLKFQLQVNHNTAKEKNLLVDGHLSFKDTHRKNAPLNKTQALTKSVNMGIWKVGTSNHPFVGSSYTEIKFSKN